ncbi:hypothetical protein Tco_0970047 [Tanacetum coccineum]
MWIILVVSRLKWRKRKRCDQFCNQGLKGDACKQLRKEVGASLSCCCSKSALPDTSLRLLDGRAKTPHPRYESVESRLEPYHSTTNNKRSVHPYENLLMSLGKPVRKATAVRKAIAFLDKQLDHLLERIQEQQNLSPQEVVMDKLMSNVEWDELIHTEMVKTVVKSEDLDLDCVHAKDGLHLHGVHVVQDMHEANQSW